MPNLYTQAESRRLISETISERGFFPPDLAARLAPVEVMQPNDFSTRIWTRTRISDCLDRVVKLEESTRLHTHSMYWDQAREGIEPIRFDINHFEGSLEQIYVRRRLADVLEKAASLLPHGYQFLVLDGYRPEAVQRDIFEKLKESLGEEEVFKYVSPPDEFASHATGAAVDLTILQGGKPVNAGGKVDEMGQLAHLHHFEGAKDTVGAAENDWRQYLQWLLRSPAILHNYFSSVVGIPTEWWHLELADTQVGAFTLGNATARYGNAVTACILPTQMR